MIDTAKVEGDSEKIWESDEKYQLRVAIYLKAVCLVFPMVAQAEAIKPADGVGNGEAQTCGTLFFLTLIEAVEYAVGIQGFAGCAVAHRK